MSGVPDAELGSIVDKLFDDTTVSRLADAALNDGQRDYLDALPEPVRGIAYGRVRAAMRTAARLQVTFCCQVGISQPALERLVGEVQAEVGQQEALMRLAGQFVAAGATFQITLSLLGSGINRATFTRLRQEQGLSGQPARKAITDNESARIYRQWQALGNPSDAGGFLALHRESGQPLYVLWGLVQDWLHQAHRKGKG